MQGNFEIDEQKVLDYLKQQAPHLVPVKVLWRQQNLIRTSFIAMMIDMVEKNRVVQEYKDGELWFSLP